MTDPPAARGGNAAPALVDHAAAALRGHTDAGWIRARDRVRSVAMSANRRGWPLALHEAPGLFVSDQVVVGLLRETIEAVEHSWTQAIAVTPVGDTIAAVDIEIEVEYGYPIAPLGAQVRRRTVDVLRRLLASPVDEASIRVEVVSVRQLSRAGCPRAER